MKLEGKVAIITGAGSGFGRASAILFAKEGAKIVVVDINSDTGNETVDLIKKGENEASFLKGDVSKLFDAEKMIKFAVDNYGKLDILFNNAGIPLSMTPVENLDEDLWDRIIDVNTKSIYLAAKIAIPIMKKQGGGVILNTCSVSAARPRPGLSAYTASKAAAVALTKALAIEVASFNIRVNSISPVASETAMFPGFLSEAMRQDMESARKAFVDTIPLGRFADPEDIAKGALYLASDEASMVTGVDLFIDGGRSI